MGTYGKNPNPIAELFAAAVRLFVNLKLPYFVIGGLAASVIGEPRFTADVDLDVFIDEADTGKLLKVARKMKFRFVEREILENLAQLGAFRMAYGLLHMDVLRASTELEREALKRARKIRIHGVSANFPSPEDLILLKLIAGREQDILDAHAVLIRHRKNLDKAYLERWAQTVCDESQDMRVYRTVHQWLEESSSAP